MYNVIGINTRECEARFTCGNWRQLNWSFYESSGKEGEESE